MTGSRILVQRGVADEVRTRLAAMLENVRVGDGLDPGTDMGPLIDKADVTRVDGMVQVALAYAKPIVRGGPAADGTPFRRLMLSRPRDQYLPESRTPQSSRYQHSRRRMTCPRLRSRWSARGKW